MTLTFEQADRILQILDRHNASYPLTFSEVKRFRLIIYLYVAFGLVRGIRYSWYLHGPYNKTVNDFLMHLVNFTNEHPLKEWYCEKK